MINELIEQIGGRERLEALASFRPSGSNTVNSASHDEWMAMARALLEVLDAKPVGEFYEFEPGDWYQRSPGDKGVKKWTPLYKVQPAASSPDGWKLVPIEPTQRMIDAHTEGMVSGGATRAYRAMLAAAPAPGDKK